MKTAAIQMKQWLGANERERVCSADMWYINFANKVFPIVKQSPLFMDDDDYTQRDATISLALYFQDAIAQTGDGRSSPSYIISYTSPISPSTPSPTVMFPMKSIRKI